MAILDLFVLKVMFPSSGRMVNYHVYDEQNAMSNLDIIIMVRKFKMNTMSKKRCQTRIL